MFGYFSIACCCLIACFVLARGCAETERDRVIRQNNQIEECVKACAPNGVKASGYGRCACHEPCGEKR
jgi:hypothetical protein